MSGKTIRLTMAQAVVRYLAAQRSEIDGPNGPREVPLVAGKEVPKLGFFGRMFASLKHYIGGGA